MTNKKQELITKVTTCKVNYRKSRSVSDDTLAGTLEKGVNVSVVDSSKKKYNGVEWEKILIDENYYYIMSEYIK